MTRRAPTPKLIVAAKHKPPKYLISIAPSSSFGFARQELRHQQGGFRREGGARVGAGGRPEGLGANLPEDAIYPLNLVDEAGQPLDGANNYTIHFDKGAMPPVGAFWSITLYDRDGFQVANSLNRFALSSWMPFRYNADGSLDLYFQNQNPGSNIEANWLPAPKGRSP